MAVWLVVCIVIATLCAANHPSSNAEILKAEREFHWNDTIEVEPLREGDILYEEIAIVPLKSNSCTDDIDNIINHIPSIDSNLSYETIYSNGSRTYTLFQITEITSCNIDEQKRNQLNRSAKPARRRTSQKRRLSIFDSVLTPSIAMVWCGAQCPTPCGGVLVGPKHVLASARCLDNQRPHNVKVGFSGRGDSVEWFGVDRFYIPRPWLVRKRRHDVENDYALIRLMKSPNRPVTGMMPASTVPDHPTYWSFDRNFNMHQIKCTPLVKPNGVRRAYCISARNIVGSGLFVQTALNDYVIVGVISRDLGRNGYLATAFSKSQVQQIRDWVNKA